MTRTVERMDNASQTFARCVASGSDKPTRGMMTMSTYVLPSTEKIISHGVASPDVDP